LNDQIISKHGKSVVHNRKEAKRQIKKTSLLESPRYNLRPLATTTKDVLHIHGGHNDGGGGGSEVTNQLSLPHLPVMVREPGLHPAEVLAATELHGSEGNTGTLLDSCHHSLLMVLHQENLPEASFLHLMAGYCQLLLQC
jgi:hypothetical protein